MLPEVNETSDTSDSQRDKRGLISALGPLPQEIDVAVSLFREEFQEKVNAGTLKYMVIAAKRGR